jgi:hypothetical protein
MVNHLIVFGTPRTTAEQRRTPRSAQMAPRRPKGPAYTDLATSFRTAITMNLAMPTGPTTKAMPPRADPGGPPVALSARRRS